jgi:hypothetical protein
VVWKYKYSCASHEGILRNGAIDLCRINLSIRSTWAMSFTFRPVYPRRKSLGTNWGRSWVGLSGGLDCSYGNIRVVWVLAYCRAATCSSRLCWVAHRCTRNMRTYFHSIRAKPPQNTCNSTRFLERCEWKLTTTAVLRSDPLEIHIVSGSSLRD